VSSQPRLAAVPVHPVDVQPRAASRAFETIVALGGIQAAAMAFNLLRAKIVAVTLGPAGVGAASVIDQVAILIAQFAACSLPLAGVKFLSAADSESHEEFERLYSAFFRVLLLLSLAGTSLSVIIVLWRPAILGPDLARYRSAAVLGLLAIPAMNLTVLLTNAIAASRRTRASALYGLAISITLTVFCWGGITLAGFHGYYLANLAAMIAAVAGGTIYLWQRQHVHLLTTANPFHQLRQYSGVMKFSGAMYITSLTSPLSDLLVRYAVLETGGLFTTGLFQAAVGLSLILRNVMRPSFSLFLTPVLNRKTAAGEKLREAATFLRVLTALIGAGALPLVLFPKWWLLLVYSHRFESAAPFVYLFVLGISIQVLASVNIALLLGLDDAPAYVSAIIVSDIATALFAWWLAPTLGLLGVGLAFILDGAVAFILAEWCLWSRHKLIVHRSIGWMPPAVLAIIGAAGTIAARWDASSGTTDTLKVALCAIFAFYLLRAVGGSTVKSFFRAFRPST
jgi:O-antigen/teichoic acid export membrane protein